MPVTPDRFEAAKRAIAALLEADPQTSVDEAREQLTAHDFPWPQVQRAYIAVRRELAQPAVAATHDTLRQAGILPPQAGVVPPAFQLEPPALPLEPPARVYPSDSRYPTEAFIEAYDTLAAAYEHKVNARTRDVYYRQLVLEEGCTIEECVAAVPFLLRAEGVWPRIAVWLRTVYTVRQHRARGSAGAQREPTVDAAGNAVWACAACRDTFWRPECGCAIEALVAGYCERHPRIENGLTYRQRFVRCDCQHRQGAAS